MKHKITILILFSLFTLGTKTFAQELPKADFNNSFYILPLYGQGIPNSPTYEEREFQFLKMKNELGVGNLYHRLGFSDIFSPYFSSEYVDNFKLAKKHGLHLGLIFALQFHTRYDIRDIADTDLRMYQWRKDGEDWKGAYTNSGDFEVPEDERDYKIPTISRLAKKLIDHNYSETSYWAKSALKLMNDYPGVVTSINGPIEEELPIGGANDVNKLGDYSPYAVTEFRDWLRHANIYDASTGEYGGEGASSFIIGDLINFNGTLRSQFYDDSTPEDNNGTGISFNDFFGTSFKTWSLKYWDLTIYTDPITDEDFDLSPESGQGYTDGGFDAPIGIDASDPFWSAWSWDSPDHRSEYPLGNPEAPAFGFRQVIVRNFVRDLFDILKDEGLPEELFFAHQIPGEALGEFTGEDARIRSSASPVWTGYLEKFSTVGITRFGPIDPSLMLQYADNWGIFEWHTQPFADPNSWQLYNSSEQALNNYYKNKCHILFPGWWHEYKPTNESIFPLNDSQFAKAISDFMKDKEEVPYHQQGKTFDYSPPKVNGLQATVNNNIIEAKWDTTIWENLVAKWTDWSQFSLFEVQWSEDGNNWTDAGTTRNIRLEIVGENKEYHIRVRAKSTKGEIGPWSDIIQTVSSDDFLLQADAKFDTLYFDASVRNPVTISLSNPNLSISPDSLQVTVTGDGIGLNTKPADTENIEKFWPMNSESDATSFYNLEKVVFEGGLLSATVSTQEPVDPYFALTSSSLNGADLPYIGIRMFSSVASQGQLFWFYDNYQFSTFDFDIKAGWHTYKASNLPKWVSQHNIDFVRLDPGTIGDAQILIDWIAISSQPISDEFANDFSFDNGKATITTSPFNKPGSYQVIADYKGKTDSITIQTSLPNKNPNVSLILPTADTIIEAGKTLQLNAIASDNDGDIKKLTFLLDGNKFAEVFDSPYSYDWIAIGSGTHTIQAEAFDNNNATTLSSSISVEVRNQLPYGDELHEVPGKIEAEDYDTGGEKIAYADKEPTNLGDEYRNDGVDIGLITDSVNQYYVGWTNAGEWLEYSIDAQISDKMKFEVSVASVENTGEFHFELDGVRLCNNVIVNSTEGEQIFMEISIKDVFISEGYHNLKLIIDKGNFNINYVDISKYEIISGIENIIDNNSVSLYPNPAQDKLYFSIQNDKIDRIEIRSMSGRIINTYDYFSTDKGFLDISEITSGIYIVNIFSANDDIWIGKFIKL